MTESRAIPGFPGYRATERGEIISKSGKPLAAWTARNPNHTNPVHYAKVGLWRDGHRHRALVHRLVCLAFHGPAPADAPDCAHLDHDPTNNTPSNLQWQSRADNMRDANDRRTARQIDAAEDSARRADQLGHDETLVDIHIQDVPF